MKKIYLLAMSLLFAVFVARAQSQTFEVEPNDSESGSTLVSIYPDGEGGYQGATVGNFASFADVDCYKFSLASGSNYSIRPSISNGNMKLWYKLPGGSWQLYDNGNQNEYDFKAYSSSSSSGYIYLANGGEVSLKFQSLAYVGAYKTYLYIASSAAPLLSTTYLTALASAGVVDTVRITSREAWTATSDASWITLAKTSGSGSDLVPISVSANSTGNTREAFVKFSSASGDRFVTVSQGLFAKDSYEPNNSTSTATVLKLGSFVKGKATVSTTNANLHNYSDNDYYKLVLKDSSNYLVHLKKTSDQTFYGYMYVSNWKSYQYLNGTDFYMPVSGPDSIYVFNYQSSPTNYTYTFDVTRFTKDSIVALKSAVVADRNGNFSEQLSFYSTQNWTATSSQDWLYVSNSGYNGLNQLDVSLGYNSDDQPRVASATITTDGGKSIVIYVTQNGALDKYELNNTVETAALLPLSYTGNVGFAKTDGAFVSGNTDLDFYRVVIPAGTGQNKVKVSLQNNWYSSDGTYYTLPAGYSYRINDGDWSSFSNTSVNEFYCDASSTIDFQVEGYYNHFYPYWYNYSGTYALQLDVVKNFKNLTIDGNGGWYTADSSSENSYNFNVNSNVPWTLSSTASWITISPASGTVDQSVLVKVNSSNKTAQSRLATIVLASSDNTLQTSTLHIQQLGAPNYSVSTDTLSLKERLNDNYYAKFYVTTNTSLYFYTEEDWFQIEPNYLSESGWVYAYTSSIADSVRHGVIRVYGDNVADKALVGVGQPAGKLDVPTLSVSTNNLTIEGYNSALVSFDVKSNTSWSFSSDAGWLYTNTSSNVFGNATFTIFANENPTTVSRSGEFYIYVNDTIWQKITVVQKPKEVKTFNLSQWDFYFNQNGGSITAQLTSNTHWYLTPYSDWVKVEPTEGTGNAVIKVTVAPSSADDHGDYVGIGGDGIENNSFYVEQWPESSLMLSSDNFYFTADSSSSSFTVSSPHPWKINVSSLPSWLHVSPISGAKGDAKVTVSVGRNLNYVSRSLQFQVYDTITSSSYWWVYVSQESAPNELSVSYSDILFGAATSTISFTVNSNSEWGIDNYDSNWIEVTPTEGASSTIVTISVPQNYETYDRSSSLRIYNNQMSVYVNLAQSGTESEKEFSVTANALEIDNKASSSVLLGVVSNTSWNFGNLPSWLSVNPVQGSNSAVVTFTALSSNTSSSERKASVIAYAAGLASQTIVFTQAGAASLDVSKTQLSVATSDAATLQFDIASNLNWLVSSDVSWITFSQSSGSGNKTIVVNVDANIVNSSRSAVVTIRGGDITRTLSITQYATPVVELSTLSLSASALTLAASEGSSANFSIQSNAAWTLSIDSDWLSASVASGSGDKTISLVANANTGKQRVAKVVVKITGDTIIRSLVVTQDSANTTALVSLSSVEKAVKVFPNPSNGKFSVSTQGAFEGKVNLSVKDLNGTTIWSASESKATIDVDVDVKSGYYILELQGDNKRIVKSIVITK